MNILLWFYLQFKFSVLAYLMFDYQNFGKRKEKFILVYQLQYFTSIKSYPNKPIHSPLAKKKNHL
jgi:hypothetical protein